MQRHKLGEMPIFKGNQAMLMMLIMLIWQNHIVSENVESPIL